MRIEVDPWEYAWVAFVGSDGAQITESCGFALQSRCHLSRFPELIESIDDIIHHMQTGDENDYYLLSRLYNIFTIFPSRLSTHRILIK